MNDCLEKHRDIFSYVMLAMALAVSAAAPARAAEALQITETGVGPIVATTPFSVQRVQQLLPGYAVKMDKRSTEGESYRVILVTRQGRTLATINPAAGEKRIFSIRVGSGQVVNKLGPKIGSNYASIFGPTVSAGCHAGAEELSGKVICSHPKSKHVSYLLSGRSNGLDGSVPPIATLSKFVVEEIIWRP